MNKMDLKLLEKVFSNEVTSNLPFQSKSKEYVRLEEAGYVRRHSVTLPGRFPVRVDGWALTTLGHFRYCMAQKGEVDT